MWIHHSVVTGARVPIMRYAAGVSCVAAVILVSVAARQAPRPTPLETFVALAINTTGVGPTGGGTVLIEIARWSTDEERSRAAAALRGNGAEDLLATLGSFKDVGTLRPPTGPGFRLKYARDSRLPNGRRLVAAARRPAGAFDRPDPPDAASYPFTVIELDLDARDRGKGRVVLYARLGTDDTDGALKVDNYTEEPIQLVDVAKQK